MNDTLINDETLNLEIRKFLKHLGITSQREIEQAIYAAAENGQLGSSGKVSVQVTLELPGLGASRTIAAELALR